METMPEDATAPLGPPLPFGKNGAADTPTSSTVLAGLDPAIHSMDPRIKSGDDENANGGAAIAGPSGTQAEMTLAPPAGMKPLTDDAANVTLDDVYTKTDGTVFLNGIQALVRLPMVQIARDRAAGLNTACLVTGYRGSPLGGYDLALGKAKRRLADQNIVFRPAVNEELAATALQGTQEAGLSPGIRHDGVFGIWYGKGPGADRTGDAFKHGNIPDAEFVPFLMGRVIRSGTSISRGTRR